MADGKRPAAVSAASEEPESKRPKLSEADAASEGLGMDIDQSGGASGGRESAENHGAGSPAVLNEACRFCDKLSVFVNREQAIARIFCINTLVASDAQQSPEINQRLGVPLLTQTYGAGKSALAKNYVRRLHDAATIDAITTLAATTEFSNFKGAIIEALANFQAKGDAEPLCIRIEVNEQADLDSIWMEVVEITSGVRDRINALELRRIISDVRRTRAVALFIDEVGRLEAPNGFMDGNGYGRYKALRGTLVYLIKDQARELKPLHVGVMGKVSMGFFHLTRGSPASSHMNFPVTLEPLRDIHVHEIYRAYTLHDHPSCRTAQSIEELAAMGAFETVARLTGGVPRQIHHMLSALILSRTKLQPTTAVAVLTDLAHKMATRMGARWFVSLKEDTIAKYVNLLACARLGLPLRVPRDAEFEPWETPQERADEDLFRAVSFLPALLHFERSTETHDIYSVTVAPIFALGLSHFLSDANGILGVAKAAATGIAWMDKESRIEWAMLLHVVAALTASQDQCTLSLHGVFPFLAGRVDDVAIKLRQTDGIVARLDCVITKQDPRCQDVLKRLFQGTVADKRSKLASLAGPDCCVVTKTQPEGQAVGPSAPDVILGMKQHLWGVQSKAGAQPIAQADLKAEVGKALSDARHPTVLIVMADTYGEQLGAKLKESGGVWVNRPGERVTGAGQDSTEFDVPEGATLVVVSKEVADKWMKFVDAQVSF